MALGSTQLLTEMSTRNLPGGKGRQVRGADNLTAICEPIVYKMWEPRHLTILWAFTACYGIALPFITVFSLPSSEFGPMPEHTCLQLKYATAIPHYSVWFC
jgi:hypothetical protein